MVIITQAESKIFEGVGPVTDLSEEYNQYYADLNECIVSKVANGRLIGVVRFLYTVAIIADLNEVGYRNRWCYKDLVTCLGAFGDWDGVGEPEGWHREPFTGRRRDDSGNEYVAL